MAGLPPPVTTSVITSDQRERLLDLITEARESAAERAARTGFWAQEADELYLAAVAADNEALAELRTFVWSL